MTSECVAELARECGFDIAGVARAVPAPEAEWFLAWAASGMAGEMTYLTGHRAEIRRDPRRLLPSARSVIAVGKLYNGPEPYSTEFDETGRAWISRYAWGDDYHDALRRGLERLAGRLGKEAGGFEWKACVDTAPFLDAAYARQAGLGWIAKNTCLIHEGRGSWFFLGALLVSLELEPDAPPPERCGSCTRCIEACPTQAIVPDANAPLGYSVDARRCISYLTIELRGPIPEELRPRMGRHVFGCDVCQDVCPWNERAPATRDPAFAPRHYAPPLERLAALTEEEFRSMFRGSPVTRAKYRGFLRNVAVAMGNSGRPEFRPALEKLIESPEPLIAEHARWARERLASSVPGGHSS